MTAPHEITNVITQNPDDDRVLECAVTGKAHFIISGDKHLLNLKAFRDIQIISPKDFLLKHSF
ncbi:MAG: hypothetical protein HY587_02740 [Candidatus Omnitrophica bacterium]|nr:hypothetical protein [Candidatus Omnitrophota bacterium]